MSANYELPNFGNNDDYIPKIQRPKHRMLTPCIDAIIPLPVANRYLTLLKGAHKQLGKRGVDFILQELNEDASFTSQYYGATDREHALMVDAIRLTDIESVKILLESQKNNYTYLTEPLVTDYEADALDHEQLNTRGFEAIAYDAFIQRVICPTTSVQELSDQYSIFTHLSSLTLKASLDNKKATNRMHKAQAIFKQERPIQYAQHLLEKGVYSLTQEIRPVNSKITNLFQSLQMGSKENAKIESSQMDHLNYALQQGDENSVRKYLSHMEEKLKQDKDRILIDELYERAFCYAAQATLRAKYPTQKVQTYYRIFNLLQSTFDQKNRSGLDYPLHTPEVSFILPAKMRRETLFSNTKEDETPNMFVYALSVTLKDLLRCIDTPKRKIVFKDSDMFTLSKPGRDRS